MKKKTGHRNTSQIRQFAYDTKYKRFFTEGHVLPCSCGHSTRFNVYQCTLFLGFTKACHSDMSMAPIVVWPSRIMSI